MNISDLKVKIYADGADHKGMVEMYQRPWCQGFTTNPSLMKEAGVTDYKKFSQEILEAIPDRSISFEVFADDYPEMKRQALELKSWGKNVYVKIPVMNTKKETSYKLIEELTNEGVTLNVTAIFTTEQVKAVSQSMAGASAGIISVFAGRIANTGRDPKPVMKESHNIIQGINPKLELLWASCRELFNIYEAEECGCEIITVPNGILQNLDLVGKDLEAYSHETVVSFYQDAANLGYSL